MAAALLDMDWYSNTEVKDFDVNAFEKASMDKYGLIQRDITSLSFHVFLSYF